MSAVEDWLHKVHEEGGSDLFVTADAPPCIKVNGKIRPITTEVLLPEEVAEIVHGIMTKKQSREFEETQECQFAIALERMFVSGSVHFTSRPILVWSADVLKPVFQHSRSWDCLTC